MSSGARVAGGCGGTRAAGVGGAGSGGARLCARAAHRRTQQRRSGGRYLALQLPTPGRAARLDNVVLYSQL